MTSVAGIPAWLHMVAQRKERAISLLAFEPYQAHYPRAPGGVDLPPPLD